MKAAHGSEMATAVVALLNLNWRAGHEVGTTRRGDAKIQVDL
jgi:hypothetical protein